MKKQFFYLLLALFLFLTAAVDKAFSFDVNSLPVKTTLIAEEETIQPGRPFWVAIELKIEKDWHAYWKNPGDSGMALEIDWQLPAGFTLGKTEWPYPQCFDQSSMKGYGYTDEVWLLAEIIPPVFLSKETDVEISADVNWLVCSDQTCLPGSDNVMAKMSVAYHPPAKQEISSGSFEKARLKIPKKQGIMQAERKDGLIELTFQSPVDETISLSANFFPEQNNVIDSKAQSLLIPPTKPQDPYKLILKSSSQEQNKTAFLKGVLVLKKESVNQAFEEALEVQVPLINPITKDSVADIDPLESHEISAASSQKIPAVVVDQFDGGIGLALFLAFIGGLLLNLMPCVLPVISFKILSFVKMAGQSRILTLKHGLSFGFGVIFSFWLLAGAMLVLQAYGHSVGWGFQLQEPFFVAFLAALLLIFALSLFGVFELGTSVTGLASKGENQDALGLMGSFLSGMLATALATPCTGPFLGSAIGFAVTLPPILALLIFTSLGLGMALPYLVLSANPTLIRFLPKPGQWMVIFKEMMGFFMIATILWLLWVFGAQTGTLGLIFLLAAFFFLALGCWIYGTWGTPVKTKRTRWLSYFAVLICFSFAGYIISKSSSFDAAALVSSNEVKNQVWQEFSESKIADLQKNGKAVFVDFTAKWCLICQTNHLVLSTPEVSEKFEKLGVVRMKADWTKNDPEITKALRKLGRNGVPLYVLYSPNEVDQPTILPQILTPDTLLKHLDTLAEADVK
jgi:thiol:disulfide interchange protein